MREKKRKLRRGISTRIAGFSTSFEIINHAMNFLRSCMEESLPRIFGAE